MIYDVYGTLADWESGLYNALQPLLSRFPSASRWSRDEVITAFLSVESDIQAQHPSMLYSDLLAKAHEVLEARLIASEDGAGGKDGATLEGAAKSSDVPGESSASGPGSDNVHTVFGNSIQNWAPFKDSAKALQELSKHFHLIVLSNVDHASFAYTHAYLSEGTAPLATADLKQAPPLYSRPSPNTHAGDLWIPRLTPGSKSPFSLILTAQDTGAYKPSHTGFITALEAIRSEPYLRANPGSSDTPTNQPTLEEIKAKTLSVAQSLTHDHRPAKELGITSVWIDRQGASLRPTSGDGKEYGWTWRFETMGDLALAVAKEVGDKE
ncbi:hypothetical protein DXG01_014784 [Tephrocybe rancida]|nr:hypothetical protein DXG01_014784 [Tephrocybe rancida]